MRRSLLVIRDLTSENEKRSSGVVYRCRLHCDLSIALQPLVRNCIDSERMIFDSKEDGNKAGLITSVPFSCSTLSAMRPVNASYSVPSAASTADSCSSDQVGEIRSCSRVISLCNVRVRRRRARRRPRTNDAAPPLPCGVDCDAVRRRSERGQCDKSDRKLGGNRPTSQRWNLISHVPVVQSFLIEGGSPLFGRNRSLTDWLLRVRLYIGLFTGPGLHKVNTNQVSTPHSPAFGADV